MDVPTGTADLLIDEVGARGHLAAISPETQHRPIVVVLGMHRSGTSLCSHILSALGVDMADDIGASRGNDKGHWERWEIVEFHDRILALLDRAYYGAFHDFPLPAAWWADPRIGSIRREIMTFLEGRMTKQLFGFKDPRTLRLFPLWYQIFDDLKLIPKIVYCIRNPTEVARSLNVRDRLDTELGEYRWLVYLADFFRYTKNYEICTLEYEKWFENPRANYDRLKNFLNLRWHQGAGDLDLMLSAIVDPSLRHDSSEHRIPNQPIVRLLYRLATGTAHDREQSRQLNAAVTQFLDFQQLQEPFYIRFCELAAVGAKVPKIEKERDEHATALTATREQVNAVEARLVEAQKEAKARSAELAAVARERDEHATALTATREQVNAVEARLVEAQKEGEASRAELASVIRERDEQVAAAREQLRTAEARLVEASSEIAAQLAQLALARKVNEELSAALREDLRQPPQLATAAPNGWRAATRALGSKFLARGVVHPV
jgi:hypothetical protein